MDTLPRFFSTLSTTKTHQIFLSYSPSFSFPRTHQPSTSTKCHKIKTSKFANFLLLQPESKSESLDFDLPLRGSSNKSPLDVIITGAGPTGLRLADQVSGHGILAKALGIRDNRALEDEKGLIPMGGPLPKTPQSVMAIGGNSGVVHPSTGYMLARTMGLASVLADAMVEGLGSTRMIRGKPLYNRVWNGLWPIERMCDREFYFFVMETLLKLDLNGARRFFDAFFDLKPHYWHSFLSSKLTLGELVLLSLSLFGHASAPSKVDIVTKCPVPLLRMMGNLALDTI